jgi:hypothetical protein
VLKPFPNHPVVFGAYGAFGVIGAFGAFVVFGAFVAKRHLKF